MQEEAPVPALPDQAPQPGGTACYFLPLTVFLGHKMPPPATSATGPAASPSEELDGFTNPHSPEGKAGGKLPVSKPKEQAAPEWTAQKRSGEEVLPGWWQGSEV